ncbi:hypothetical protein KGA66_03515 [Actinocrinis puniceicyclus]|jgi:hypothetical protein|uniref:DeoxyPurine in DNA protein A domain-containing protein n=1 Tax=Actinocrinis puniceicyclus TaxID=977794 RepID=A0A8J7WLW8_9ACTN|nr:hypothetical protein [Actinocrinis puniceicyclus]MBS2962102.1 hypothetical protein [Actinocrinis puniceicyclus]
MPETRFYLGAHHPNWLSLVDFPLFISHRRLTGRATLPRARAPWALDSGGFTELSMYGAWQTTPEQYVAAVRRYRDEIGLLTWAAPQDLMCEPFMLAKTGLSVTEHQARTVGNYLRLRELAPDLPFVPVLQGWVLPDYLACLRRYERAGIDLATLPLVGLGSVCRRQATGQIAAIVSVLAGLGLNLHGFGVKTLGLSHYAEHLASADSMAWSLNGRHTPGCTPTHRNEANCLPFASSWRRRILTALRSVQLSLPVGGAA